MTLFVKKRQYFGARIVNISRPLEQETRGQRTFCIPIKSYFEQIVEIRSNRYPSDRYVTSDAIHE